MSPLARREARWGYLFISPWIIGFLLFTLGPMVATSGFTFSNVNLPQEEPLRFVGLDNWTRTCSPTGRRGHRSRSPSSSRCCGCR